MRLALVAAVVLAVAACANPAPTPVPPSIPALPSQEASAPVLVQGRLLDPSGSPIAGAEVTLDALDPADDGTNASFPPAFRAASTTGADGSFVFRVAPTPGLVALAAGNDSWVNFRLRGPAAASSPADQATAPFSRAIADGGWAGEPETIKLQVGGD
jgi:hypothetical protein